MEKQASRSNPYPALALVADRAFVSLIAGGHWECGPTSRLPDANFALAPAAIFARAAADIRRFAGNFKSNGD
jgi:hypothetical protein